MQPKSKGLQTDSTSEVSMASLTKLLESHRTAISEDFKQTLTVLESKLSGVGLIATVEEHGGRLVSLKHEGHARDSLLKLAELNINKLQTAQVKLSNKVLELESRNRRKNLRIIGIPEDMEMPQPTVFFAKLIEEVFGDVIDRPVECELARQSFGAKPQPSERPRPAIVRLLSFQVKDTIIRYARTMRGKLKYRNHSILVFEDYPPEIVALLKTYKTVLSEQYLHGFKPALWNPANLYIKLETGESKNLSTMAEAEAFIRSLPSRDGVD